MADCIDFKDIPYYSDLILDYLGQKTELKFAYHRFPSTQNFKLQFEEKGKSFPLSRRKILVSTLEKQYREFATPLTKATSKNIALLEKENTFTITTGHQLNLFTGPLYFFYKIIAVLNLCEKLKNTYPKYNFVPVYWLASEDHDFEEINHFSFRGENISWNTPQKGAVGRFDLKGLDKVLEFFREKLNHSENATYLIELFKKAYTEQKNLTAATHYIANELLGKYGLVIIDGDDHELKKVFAPYMEEELLKKTAFQKVNENGKKLEQLGYFKQVNPREINLFYLGENYRERIVNDQGKYGIHNTKTVFSKAEMLKELETHPENFSPNAIMRPLYQEVILPNLCYVGGSGELAYWLELKDYFKSQHVIFPILLMRNSALLISEKQREKIERLNLTPQDLFMPPEALEEKQTRALSNISIDFTPQKEYLLRQFRDLYRLAKKTDRSFFGAVAAQEKKQLNGLDHLEKRLLKAQKRKLRDQLERATSLQEKLFPGGNLQERTRNFSGFYEIYGENLISTLKNSFDPLSLHFDIITL